MNSKQGATDKKWHEALQNIGFESNEEKKVILMLLQKYGKYLNSSKVETQERYKFFSRMKKDNESIEDFIADLREKAKTCNFDSLADSFIRDKIIVDTKDEKLRKIFLNTENIDLKKIITIYNFHELRLEKLNQTCKEKSKKPNITPSTTNEPKDYIYACSKCGTQHAFRNCPAFRSKCRKCEGLGHYTKMCNGYLARISFKPNRPDRDADDDGPFSQINKNRKVVHNAGNKIPIPSNNKKSSLPGGELPRRVPPPKYTQYPASTEVYNFGCMGPSASHKKLSKVTNSSITVNATSESATMKTHASTADSDTKSTVSSIQSSVSDNDTVVKNAKRKGSSKTDRRRKTSSSSVKSTPVHVSKEADDDFAVKCCSCLIC